MEKYAIEIKWGVIFFAVSLLWMVLEKLSGLHGENIAQHATYTNFFAVPAIVMFVFAMLEKRKKFYGGVMTWKQGFGCGMVITMVVVMLSPIAQLVTHLWISPDYFANVIEYIVSVGEVSRAEAEEYFNLKNYIMQSIIGALIMGAVTSAVVAVFVRKS